MVSRVWGYALGCAVTLIAVGLMYVAINVFMIAWWAFEVVTSP